MSTAETTTATRWIVVPDGQSAEPDRALVGGKAWSLWRMASLGLTVPPAFVVTTDACRAYFDGGKTLPDGLIEELRSGIAGLEHKLGRTFGGSENPLLVSVRSGAAVSMPGMMDTILNLGFTDDVEGALAAETGSPEFAAEVNRRFHAFYGQLVLGCVDDLETHESAAAVRNAIRSETGADVPQAPWQQLECAVASVFESSRTRRAIAYRKHHGIPQDLGTAVTIQAMVFGNVDDDSGTGVLFSRNPLSGASEVYGEYLPRGQGEDVVSGRVTPEPLDGLARRSPSVHDELLSAARQLDADGRDAQDIEFTVQHGTLYMLQSRPAKRTARAAVRIAVELVDEGVLTPREALRRVAPAQVATVLRPVVDPDAAASATLIASGTSACPGVASGLAVATPEEAEQIPNAVLVRQNTSPEDVHGMIAAVAVVTETGGATSHAAVVSRALDTPCVVGCADAVADLVGKTVTVDAVSGHIYADELPTVAVDEANDCDLQRLLAWATEFAPITVVADDADAPQPLFDPSATGDFDPDAMPTVPPGTASVAGAIFSRPDALRAALDAGITTVVAPRALPVLLAAIALQEESR
ncbi:pyruvate, phosphate dikinase [Rhodococcoides kyotonense]|uniref:Pyruvate, orthophosphate dikinase n=1 Tax=Rhodococcoides kyotonense TaxID=398843 RepID=A0A239DSZ8_9NOCA|nr:pyruvate, phosphate dikinase [Rhodococcus kyotonensis]SNS35745.1 pyruvate, orthophosphate dikinase [Rhodococcus kyotonensis]